MKPSELQLNLVAFISIAFIIYYFLNGIKPAVSPLNLVGGLITAAGFFLWMWSLKTLGRHLTADVKPRSPTLFIDGPYALVRHPIYLGATLFLTGLLIIARHPAMVVFIGLVIAVEIVKATREEEELIKHFPEYVDYKKRVGFLLPKIKR